MGTEKSKTTIKILLRLIPFTLLIALSVYAVSYSHTISSRIAILTAGIFLLALTILLFFPAKPSSP